MLPEAPAIVLLVAVSALTVGLAVRNDSQPLAALAIAGGFLAPILVGDDGGPLAAVRLFRGAERRDLRARLVEVVARAQRRGLRLHVRARALLGPRVLRARALRDRPAVPRAVLRLLRRRSRSSTLRRAPLAAKDPVDGLLVFGVPLVGFALQAALVHDYRYGAAWSALALARRLRAALRGDCASAREPGFALLSRAFLALAVIFATIAIPFALDDRCTAALWAVEAAGVYWIGVRQNARFARAFALLVEVGAGIVFALSGVAGADDPLFANAYFAGAMLIALSGLAIACIADRAGERLTAGERALVPALFGWGVLWWLAAGGVELVRQLPRADEAHAVLAWVTASVALALALVACAALAAARRRRRRVAAGDGDRRVRRFPSRAHDARGLRLDRLAVRMDRPLVRASRRRSAARARRRSRSTRRSTSQRS